MKVYEILTKLNIDFSSPERQERDETFLRSYLSSLQVQVPFVSGEDLCRVLDEIDDIYSELDKVKDQADGQENFSNATLDEKGIGRILVNYFQADRFDSCKGMLPGDEAQYMIYNPRWDKKKVTAENIIVYLFQDECPRLLVALGDQSYQMKLTDFTPNSILPALADTFSWEYVERPL